MTRITEEEAKALWITLQSVNDYHRDMNSAVEWMRKRMWIKKRPDIKKKRATHEDNDAERLASRLKWMKYKFTHIPNESWVHWKAWMFANMKKKSMWMSTWYPDFTIYLKNWLTMHIELKKARRKKVDWEFYALSTDWIVCSDEQKEWIRYLNSRKNTVASFCFWYFDALTYIKQNEWVNN